MQLTRRITGGCDNASHRSVKYAGRLTQKSITNGRACQKNTTTLTTIRGCAAVATLNMTKWRKILYANSDDNPRINYISLFSGYEGIGLGINRALGGALRTIAYCEREKFACSNLAYKVEAGLLDPAPIFTDVHTFPWEQYAPFMADGIMSFGFPCQPFSCAGKRKGTEDERWLFDVCCDGIEILKPRFAFAENVEGLLSAKMPDGTLVIGHIITRLEALGYTVEGGIFSAEECGAPHRRKRVFILAKLPDARLLSRCTEQEQQQEERPEEFNGGGELANRNSVNRSAPTEKRNHDGQTRPASEELANTVRKQDNRERCISEPQRDALGRCAETTLSDDREASTDSSNQCSEELANNSSKGLEGNLAGVFISQGRENAGGSVTCCCGSSGKENVANMYSAGLKQGNEKTARELPEQPHRCSVQPWPARPGQQQYEWEPPRVVGNTEHDGHAATENRGSSGAEQEEGWVQKSERGREQAADNRQIKPALGGNFNESTDRLVHAELYESCDNRTDELRLLGNGVCIPTVTRAWEVLYRRLTEGDNNEQH